MNGQQDMFLDYVPAIHFKGETYNPAFDCERLNKQLRRVFDVMKDGRWRTLRENEDLTGDPQASVSARLRDFRSNEYLSQYFTMESRAREGARKGTWQYPVIRKVRTSHRHL